MIRSRRTTLNRNDVSRLRWMIWWLRLDVLRLASVAESVTGSQLRLRRRPRRRRYALQTWNSLLQFLQCLYPSGILAAFIFIFLALAVQVRKEPQSSKAAPIASEMQNDIPRALQIWETPTKRRTKCTHPKNWHFEPKSKGGWKMMFLFRRSFVNFPGCNYADVGWIFPVVTLCVHTREGDPFPLNTFTFMCWMLGHKPFFSASPFLRSPLG